VVSASFTVGQHRRVGRSDLAGDHDTQDREHVAGDSAGQADDGGQHDHPEQVEPGPRGGQAAAEAGHERARQVQNEDERGAETLGHIRRGEA
jgi:hypothetical protein